MDTDREPFGDCLFDGITDLDTFRRKTIHAAIQGIDVRAHRAAAASARPINYDGGPVPWDGLHLAEAA